CRADDRIAQPVAAAIILQLRAGRLPRRRPELARRVVTQVDVAPAIIEWDVVVAVAGDPPQPRVPIKRVAAGCGGDDREVSLTAEVVDPGQRGIGPCDDVLT